MNEPVIKWTGSKRAQAKEIIKYFPKNIETYYEPFIGGGSIMKSILEDKSIKVNKIICSDINNDLINLWNLIKSDYKKIYFYYKELWEELNKDNNIERKKIFYNEIREKFNKTKNPLDFMFIMRTTINGMPRYNKKGNFNSPFHLNRCGIKPENLYNILKEWSEKLNNYNVIFINSDYKNIIPDVNDFIYLDPPYANTKNIYYGKINVEELFNYIKNLKCKYALSFDGKSINKDNTFNVPKEIFKEHLYIKSGNSSFKKLVKKEKEMIYESLYLG